MQTALQQKRFFESSFLSCEKDLELILRKLFINSQPHSETLKRLLVINTADCLDNTTSQVYKDTLKKYDLANLKKDGYIRITPKLEMPEHEEVKSYIHFAFSDITPNYSNPKFRDMNVYIDVLCNSDYWDIGNYRLRPLKICGYIDAILNNSKLTGIGTFQLRGCSEITLSDKLSGYCMIYRAVHQEDDNQDFSSNFQYYD